MTTTAGVDRGSAGRRIVAVRRRVVNEVLDARAWAVDRTERPRRLLRPLTSVVTPTAWVLAALVVASGWGALRLGWVELRVVTGMDRATAYVNGKKFAEVTGRTAKSGLFGICAVAGKEGLVANFSAPELKGVLQPPTDGNLDRSLANPADAIFVQDPKTLDPAWPRVDFFGLRDGVPVYDSDGESVGVVDRVMADGKTGIFEGLIIHTRPVLGGRHLFASHDQIAELREQGVRLAVRRADLYALDESAGRRSREAGGPEPPIEAMLRKAWDWLSGAP